MYGSILLQCFDSSESVAVSRLAQLTGMSAQKVDEVSAWLMEIGVPLIRISPDSLRLEQSITPLDLNLIQQTVSKFDPAMSRRIEIFDAIDSTNQYLMELPRPHIQHKQVCLAEYMMRGRGRQSKSWYGGAYKNIMLSMAWEFHSDARSLSGLSLAVAVMVVRCLQRVGCATYRLKWPNDILVNDQKLSGILIEIREKVAIVGIGINCSLTAVERSAINQPVTSLNELCDRSVDRSRLVSALLSELSTGLELFFSSGFESFRNDWNQLHAYQGRRMRTRGQPIREGIALEIDDSGALILQEDNGQLVSITAGELDLLPN